MTLVKQQGGNRLVSDAAREVGEPASVESGNRSAAGAVGETPAPEAGQPLTPEEVRALDRSFNEQPTERVLAWAWERYGTRAAIGTSFQGAGLVMMHLAKQNNLPLPAFTLDTGLLFPETVAL